MCSCRVRSWREECRWPRHLGTCSLCTIDRHCCTEGIMSWLPCSWPRICTARPPGSSLGSWRNRCSCQVHWDRTGNRNCWGRARRCCWLCWRLWRPRSQSGRVGNWCWRTRRAGHIARSSCRIWSTRTSSARSGRRWPKNTEFKPRKSGHRLRFCWRTATGTSGRTCPERPRRRWCPWWSYRQTRWGWGRSLR